MWWVWVYFVASAAVGEEEDGRKCDVRAWRRDVGGDIFRFSSQTLTDVRA